MADPDSPSELSAAPSDFENQSTTETRLEEESRKGTGRRGDHETKSLTGKRKAEQQIQRPGPLKKSRTPRSAKAVAITPSRETAPTTSPSKQGSASRNSAKGNANTADAEVKTEKAEVDIGPQTPPTKRATKAKSAKAREKAVIKDEVELQEDNTPNGTKTEQVKRKRKTKEEKEAEMLPLASRTVGSKLFIGAHVSSAGGVHNAVVNSLHIGGNAFALFLKSQRKWANPPLIDEHCASFIQNCKGHQYDATKHIVPHGSYLVNLCHPDPKRTKQAYEAFLDDVTRCHKLGIKLYNFHPGNSAGAESREQAIQHLASNLNRIHADPSSGSVVTLLETMATRGNTIGGTFEDLRDTIDLIAKKDRVGVCLDTCHVFAAGYDISTPAGLSSTLDHFDATVGLRYLRALHVNDSKAPLSSHRDLHANLGTGFLGLRAFHAIVNEPRLWGLPMVLETPIDVKGEDGKEVQDKSIWATEIKLMESMVGMDTESDQFLELEETLATKGIAERQRIGDQVKRRDDKVKSPKKKLSKAKGKANSASDSEG